MIAQTFYQMSNLTGALLLAAPIVFAVLATIVIRMRNR